MDFVFIRALEIQTHIGVHAWEHQIRRPLILDLDLGMDTREAAASDHIRDALDYKAVCDALEALVDERRFQLLEAFAETAARRLFEQFPLLTLRLHVSKPGAVVTAKTVGVEINRRREDYAACGQ
jgi:7,8-dihydroneopterin aldolase/epimerase/oxygenase